MARLIGSRMITLSLIMKMRFLTALAPLALLFFFGAALVPADPNKPVAGNSWRGIVPLRSTAADVARVLGLDGDPGDHDLTGPFPVDGGEVTFSYLSASLADMFRAPKSMTGRVFTVYFKPTSGLARQDLKLTPDFKRCAEDMDKTFYYFVTEGGLAYRFVRGSDMVDVIIYQPSRSEVRRLAVNTTCVF